MSTLLVQELKTELIQEFRFILATRYNIGAFIPYLFMMSAPAGIFRFEIIKDAQTVYSVDFTCADIQAALDTTDQHARIYMPFVPAAPVYMEAGAFTARLSAVSGYAYSFESWLGWVQEYEDRTNEVTYEVVEDVNNPLAMRIKILKEGIYI